MPTADDDTAAGRIRAALAERGAGKTVCPSEIARRLAGENGDWRGRMSEVHAAVDALVAHGQVALSWKGHAMSGRQGPYRIGLPQ